MGLKSDTQEENVEIDEVSVATYVVDGDIFDVAMGERVRLADVDAPERGQGGYFEASYFLEQSIYGERVYLDVDDVYRYGPYGRLICLVYVDYNSTHYCNVNKALLEYDYARVSEYDNEFSPYGWTLFVSKVGSAGRRRLLLISVILGLGTTILINLAVRFMMRGVSSGYHRVSRGIHRELVTMSPIENEQISSLGEIRTPIGG